MEVLQWWLLYPRWHILHPIFSWDVAEILNYILSTDVVQVWCIRLGVVGSTCFLHQLSFHDSDTLLHFKLGDEIAKGFLPCGGKECFSKPISNFYLPCPRPYSSPLSLMSFHLLYFLSSIFFLTSTCTLIDVGSSWRWNWALDNLAHLDSSILQNAPTFLLQNDIYEFCNSPEFGEEWFIVSSWFPKINWSPLLQWGIVCLPSIWIFFLDGVHSSVWYVTGW